MASKESYITVEKNARAEFTEKRSQFIGSVKPVKTEQEAIAFINEIRSEFPDARHNVYAYLLREGAKTRYSDDKEPQGTAGKPILDMLVKSGVDDVCVVVTRYFGGTLLGTGGLVHAYSLGAKMAVEAAGIVQFENYVVFKVTASYSDYQKISFELERCDAIIDSTDYADNVTVQFAVKEALADSISKKMTEISSGKNEAIRLAERFDAK